MIRGLLGATFHAIMGGAFFWIAGALLLYGNEQTTIDFSLTLLGLILIGMSFLWQAVWLFKSERTHLSK